MTNNVVVQPLSKPVNLPLLIFTLPEDFQETAKKSLRRLMRQTKDLFDPSTDSSFDRLQTLDYLDILDNPKPDPKIKEYYEKVWQCSELDSTRTKMTIDRSSGQSNIPIGVAGMETATQSLSLTLMKKRTSSSSGQKPLTLILKNNQKLFSHLDSLGLLGTKDK